MNSLQATRLPDSEEGSVCVCVCQCEGVGGVRAKEEPE